MPPRKKGLFQVGDYWLDFERDRHGDPKRPNYFIFWYDPRRRKVRRKSTGTPDYQLAQEKIIDFVKEQSRPFQQSPTESLLRDVLTSYWLNHGQHIASSEQIDSSLNHFLDFLDQEEDRGHILGQATIADVSMTFQDRFIEYMQSKPIVTRNKRGEITRTRPRSKQSINRNLSDIRAALNRAHKYGEVTSVPYIRSIPLEQLESARTDRIPLNMMAQMFDYAFASKKRTHLQRFLVAAVATLARPEAILDISTDQEREQWDEENRLLNFNPKGRKQTKKYRPIVPVGDMFLPWLLATDGWYISWHGEPVKSIRTAWTTMREALQLPSTWFPKTIRHTMATELRKRKVDPWELQGQLGHRVLKTTEIYAAFDPDYLGSVQVGIASYFEDLQKHMKSSIHPQVTHNRNNVVPLLRQGQPAK